MCYLFSFGHRRSTAQVGAYTIPDFARAGSIRRFFRKIAVIFVLFIGVFLHDAANERGRDDSRLYIPRLPLLVGVVLVGVSLALNVALGGMKASRSAGLQYWAKMLPFRVPVFVLMAVYGDYGKQISHNSASPMAWKRRPSGDVARKAPRDLTWVSPSCHLRPKRPKAACDGFDQPDRVAGSLLCDPPRARATDYSQMRTESYTSSCDL